MAFFSRNIIVVYFFYGLSFFSMGLAILLEANRASRLDFARALRPLAGFGLVHGSHEWLEMFLLVRDPVAPSPLHPWLQPLRISLLAASFLMLMDFGIRLNIGPARPKREWGLMTAILLLWLCGFAWIAAAGFDETSLTTADTFTRYSLAIPGGVIAALGLIKQRRVFQREGMKFLCHDLCLAALAFGLYGGIGQLFAPSSTLFSSQFLNAEAFIHWFGFPIQVFRALMACLASVFMIRSLRAFEVEKNTQIEVLRQAQDEEKRRLEDLRADLLHQTVKAQEAERQRIARELHDELGQTLTALGMGLQGISETAIAHPQRVSEQAAQLRKLVNDGIEELQNLVAGLHPPQLDDLGLLAAIRWYAGNLQKHTPLQIQISSEGEHLPLPEEVRIVFYRITQEALTNVVRHAQATQVTIRLVQSNGDFILHIEDNGRGFDVDRTLRKKNGKPCWGLLGMIERAEQINGQCLIASSPGKGTIVEVAIQSPTGGVS